MEKIKRSSLLVMILALVVGSFAYFTDRVSKSVDMELGTLWIDNLDLEGVTPDGGAAPGDTIEYKLSVDNLGDLDADLRVTYSLSSKHEDQDNFKLKLYGENDELFVDGLTKAVIEKANVLSAGGVFEETLKLHLEDDLINKYQGASLNLEIIVEAKQHRNAEGDWTEVVTENFRLISGDNQQVVKGVSAHFALEYDLSKPSYIGALTSDLEDEPALVYLGTYEDNKEDILDNYANPAYILEGITADDNLQEVLGVDTGVYTVILRKFTRASGAPFGPGLLGSPYAGFRRMQTETLQSMFPGAQHDVLDLRNWDVSGMEDFSYMFVYSTIGELDVSGWNMRSAKDISGMFLGANIPTFKGVDTWSTKNLENLESLFQELDTESSINISKWDVSNVTNFYNLFSQAKVKEVEMSGLSFSKESNSQFHWFSGATVDKVNANDIYIKGGANMRALNFAPNINTKVFNMNNLSIDNAIEVNALFGGVMEEINFNDFTVKSPAMVNIGNLFTDLTVDKVFANNLSLVTTENYPIIGGFNFNKMELNNLHLRYEGTESYTGNLHPGAITNFDGQLTPEQRNNVSYNNWVIEGYKEIQLFNGSGDRAYDYIANIPGIDTWLIKGTDTIFAFAGAVSDKFDGKMFDVSEIKTMYNAFVGSTFNEVDLSSWDTSSLVNASRMFLAANIGTLDISSFDFTNVNVDMIFNGATMGVVYVRSENDANILRNVAPNINFVVK